MDGGILFGLVGSSVTIIVAVGGTAWHLASKISEQGNSLSSKISEQSEKIANLKGEVAGMRDTYKAVHDGCSKLFESQDRRISRIENQKAHGGSK